MLVSEKAGLDVSGSVRDGADSRRSWTSSSLGCLVGEVILVLVVLQRLHSPHLRSRNHLIRLST